ncbi:hypothetical protein GCM10010222_67800 [Streptomyces tanashiensis]|uniref:hypothetical protein n=1 Tax=Streptomyces tanashiensis TaxID=67367 RepID=UPI001676A4E5|nr:hypothetical protein [Streptomyces tanashiensis]GGT16274.1 hypothetical protein GCM10010222_67800 [Streptomyces tanashiensis]
MACEIQKVAAAVAAVNAVASTPGAAFGTVVPPLEPLLAVRMWASWFALLIALGSLAKCLEDAGQGQDAATLRREIDRLKGEMEKIKQTVPH